MLRDALEIKTIRTLQVKLQQKIEWDPVLFG